MNPFQKLLVLQAPAEQGAGAGGSTTTATTEQGADAGKGAGASAAAAAKTPESTGTDVSKSVLREAGEKKDEQKDEAAKGEGKEGAKDGKAAQDAPLELKLRDGLTVDKAVLEKATPVLKELGLDSAKASKLVEFYADLQKEQLAGREKELDAKWDAQQESFKKQLREDPEFGGKAYDESLAYAKRALVRGGGDELLAELEQLGAGNLPRLLKAFAHFGKTMAEEDTSKVGAKATTSTAELTDDERLARRYSASSKAAR